MRILADVGDVARFPDRKHFAARTGLARSTHPPGDRSTAGCLEPGSRRLNRVLYIAAACQRC